MTHATVDQPAEARAKPPTRRKLHWVSGGGPTLESSLVQPLWVGGALVALGWTVWQINLPPAHPDWIANRVSIAASALAAFAVAVLAAASLVNLVSGIYKSLLHRFGKEDLSEAGMTVMVPIGVLAGMGLGWLVWK
jgi:hypothetical protein